MKVLFITNIVSNNNIVRIQQLRKTLKKIDTLKVFFCSQNEDNRRWSVQEKLNFQYKILPRLSVKLTGKDLFTYFINPTIWREIKKHNPDRIVVGGWDQFSYQIAFIWSRLNHKQLTLWSGSTQGEKSWRRLITTPFVKALVSLSSDFIAYGTQSKKYLIKLGAPKNKIKIIFNDVNKKYFAQQAKKLKPNRKKIKKKFDIKTKHNLLFVGQFIERKGILDLLTAYKKFKKNHPNWGLVIVGYGQLEAQVKEYIQKNKLNDVYLLGAIDQYDLPSVYAACDVLVLPSSQEVWGLVVNEALYSGLKVVVSDTCGCAIDLVKPGKNGYLFKSGSITSLVSTLEKTIKI